MSFKYPSEMYFDIERNPNEEIHINVTKMYGILKYEKYDTTF